MEEKMKAIQVFKIRLKGGFRCAWSSIASEVRIEKLGQKHGRSIEKLERTNKDRFDCRRWIEQGYPVA